MAFPLFGFEMTAAVLIGLALDLVLGWPAALYARIGHPVGWLARPVAALERRFNRAERSNAARFTAGAGISLLAIATAVAVWGGLAWLAQALPMPWRIMAMALLIWPLSAARSMHDHVAAIAKPLVAGDLEGARHAVSMIVGRDPQALDQAGVARAALESLGENSSDGVIAPLFWGVVFGPAGMAGYKAINTLDSMIAHRNSRYEWFGKLAARIDDLANLIPARLTGLLFAAASLRRAPNALAIMWRDAGQHRSPNAGWPESALAAALGVRLSGPRIYGTRIAAEPWLNTEAPDPQPDDLWQGLRLFRRMVLGILMILMAVTMLQFAGQFMDQAAAIGLN